MNNKIFIVRHGETDWNKEGKIQGSTDTELNNTGKKQAQQMAKILNIKSIDLVISSPLKRAYKTAQIISKNDKPIITEFDLREREFGSIEGSSYEDLKLHYYKLNGGKTSENEKFDLFKSFELFDDVETKDSVKHRAKKAVSRYVENNKGKNLLFVTHGAVIKTLLYSFLSIPEDIDRPFMIPNCTCLELTSKKNKLFMSGYYHSESFSPNS